MCNGTYTLFPIQRKGYPPFFLIPGLLGERRLSAEALAQADPFSFSALFSALEQIDCGRTGVPPVKT